MRRNEMREETPEGVNVGTVDGVREVKQEITEEVNHRKLKV